MTSTSMRAAVGLTVVVATSLAGAARADDVDDNVRKLIELDQKVHIMSLELQDKAPVAPDMADRRLIDAQVLMQLKKYDDAATILIDIVEKYPGTPAGDEAIFILGEALFQDRDYFTAREYLRQAVAKHTGSKREQDAYQRLVEIALKTNDYDGVDGYLQQLASIPPAQLEPSVPYVRAKFLYEAGRLDEASAAFAAIPASNPYYFQARYFIGVVLVKKADDAAASQAFDAVMKLQATTQTHKDIQEQARMALARVMYEQSQFQQAVDLYEGIPRESKFFVDSLNEVAWTHIKAKEWQKAYRKLDLMLLAQPDSPQAPELKLLMGNLQLRLGNYYLANDAFTKTREEFEPIHAQLSQVIAKVQTDPAFFDSVMGKSLEKFEISSFVPANATKWVQADAKVARLLGLANDIRDLQKSLVDSEKLVARLETAMTSSGKAGVFADLASSRTRSVEVLTQVTDIQKRFTAERQKLIAPHLSQAEQQQLAQLDTQIKQLEQSAASMPKTQEGIKAKEGQIKGEYGALDAQASELNVMIQSLDAELVAIEQYYGRSRAEQKIRPEDMRQPVKDLRAELDQLRGVHDSLRDQISDASHASATAGAAGEEERSAAQKMAALLKQQNDIQMAARSRLDGSQRGQFDRIANVLTRAGAIVKQLDEFDARIDANADGRLAQVKQLVGEQKNQLASAQSRLGSVSSESQSLGGTLAKEMFSGVADRFYDLVVRSDVGLIDVAWGLKDQKTQEVTKLTNQRNQELKALDEDFHRLLEADK